MAEIQDSAAEPISRIVQRLYDRDHSKLTKRQQTLLCVANFLHQIDECGIDAFIRYETCCLASTIEALEAIGAHRSVQTLKEACQLFPGGLPAGDQAEREQQMSDITGDNRYLDEMLPSRGATELDLNQRLLNFWQREAPRRPDVDLSHVANATELLTAISSALGLSGSYGKNLDAFAEALSRAADLPNDLTLRGWDRISRIMPRDSELLLECIREVGKMHPECAVEVQFS